MSRRVLDWWEGLPARRQVLTSMAALLVVLFVVHESCFPLLDWPRSLMYSVMWSVPGALIVTFATQVEVARRRAAQPAHRTTDPAAGDAAEQE